MFAFQKGAKMAHLNFYAKNYISSKNGQNNVDFLARKFNEPFFENKHYENDESISRIYSHGSEKFPTFFHF